MLRTELVAMQKRWSKIMVRVAMAASLGRVGGAHFRAGPGGAHGVLIGRVQAAA